MSALNHDGINAARGDDQFPDPVPPAEARRAEDEALRRAGQAQGDFLAGRHLRAEVESQRVSEAVTSEARERARPAPAATDVGPKLAPQPARRLPEPLTISRLLVPIDGTAYAERALPYAASLASATGAGITLAHIRVPAARDVPVQPGAFAHHLAQGQLDVDVSDFPTYLHWLRAWLLPYVQDVDVLQTDAPSSLRGLLDLEDRRTTDLAIIASHTRDGVERLMLGSVADGLVREGREPVLVVPPLADVPSMSVPLMRRVLVPLDGSALAEQALAPVIGWLGGTPPSELAPREVVLFSVATSKATLHHAERYVADMRDRLAPLLPSVHVIAASRLGSPAGAIVSAADLGLVDPGGTWIPADLIVMATHGRGGLGRWLYGSVATYVLPRVHAPVLLTHPRLDDD